MDQTIRLWGNSVREGMQWMGSMCQLFGSALGMNPITRPWAETMNDYGAFLKEKNVAITPQAWMTPNRVVHSGLKTVLRKFNEDDRGNPVLIVPPEAGHNSQIVDYGPGQSLVRCALDHFAGDVYVLEKLPADPEHAGYSLDDCIRSLDLCIDHIGKPVHLVGLCQGGWQSAIYTALYTERVKTLTLAGAPIDFHAGNSQITQMVHTLPPAFYQSLVAMGGGCMPGAFIVGGFKLMNFCDRFVGDDVNLHRNIRDPRYLERYHRFCQWYEYTQPLGGRMYLEVVEKLFKNNQLVNGQLEVLGRRVDLSRIYQPLYLVAGTKDNITPPPQLFAIQDYAGSAVAEEILAEAGHVGLFMGTEVIRDVWTDLFRKTSSYTFDDTFAVSINEYEKAPLNQRVPGL